MREFYVTRRTRIILACALGTIVSGGFYVAGLDRFDTNSYWYLFWNILLAWVPLGLALLLERVLRTSLWSSWRALLITLLWAGFFPNTFYIITDLYHLSEFRPEDIMYNTAMFFAVVFTGVVIGFISLETIHKELLKRFSSRAAGTLVATVLLFTGFAIHLGHDLRWNTWDMVTRPASLIFDVSERILHPLQHPTTYQTTLSYFAISALAYYILWQFTRPMVPTRKSRSTGSKTT